MINMINARYSTKVYRPTRRNNVITHVLPVVSSFAMYLCIHVFIVCVYVCM